MKNQFVSPNHRELEIPISITSIAFSDSCKINKTSEENGSTNRRTDDGGGGRDFELIGIYSKKKDYLQYVYLPERMNIDFLVRKNQVIF